MQRIVWLICCFALAGCSGYPGPVSIENEDPAVKIPAMRRAAVARDSSKIASLVRELASDDPAIRLVAIESLEKITGQTHGYQWWNDARDNKAPITRWNNRLAGRPIEQGVELPAPTTAPAPGVSKG
jgi:hypothetical protein